MSKVKSTPAWPSKDKPQRTGLPIKTILAPKANAFKTSVPSRIPPSSGQSSYYIIHRGLGIDLGLQGPIDKKRILERSQVIFELANQQFARSIRLLY